MDYASVLAAEPPFAQLYTISPILVAGSSVVARNRGVALVEAAGVRLAAVVPIADAIERIELQAKAGAIWVELDHDAGEPLDRLLDRIDRDAAAGHYAAVVCASPPLIDLVAARLNSGAVDLLIAEDGNDEAERVAALALALAARPGGARLADAASDTSGARLRQLTDEVARIAATLARLSTGPGASPLVPPVTMRSDADQPAAEISPDVIRSVIRARRVRDRFFPDDLFADPAWDMRSKRVEFSIQSKRIRCIPGAALAITHRDPNPSGVNGPARSTRRGLPKQRPKAAPTAGPPLAASETRLRTRPVPIASF